MSADENLARQRFLIINLMRLSGVGFALLGLVIIAGKIDLPLMAGYLFFVFGLLDTLVVPLVLSRAWKSPPQ